jgi:succinyl-diaminopimelate desuccinylase
MSKTLEITKALIAKPSLTPDDAGCMDIMADFLQPLGFEIEYLNFDDTQNLWARRGTEAPLFVFAGHTDVVPTGPLDDWDSHPFEPTEKDGLL